MNVIDIKALTKEYGKSRGITNVNLEVNQGEIYGFIGPNGAGKSTTIKLLLNLIYPTSGSAKILNLDTVTESSQIKKLIGYVPSEVRYYGALTGEELMKSTLGFHHSKNVAMIDTLCQKLDIDKKKRIGELSLGNKKKIAIACAIIHEPKLIILDEPTSGLDPLIQKKLFELLKEQNAKGATIFISSHNLNEVEEHCTKVAFIKEGKILKTLDLNCNSPHSKIITITGSNLEKSVFLQNDFTILSQENNLIKLSFKGATQSLLDILVTQSITDLTIQNLSLEDEFLTYYEGVKAE
ncbi:MAG: ABC transporter ATP-binding protein [Oscillospiraceae bacterium]